MKRYPLNGLLSLFALYIIWGSTYLAIRVAVREGSGFSPFNMAASRTLVAGVLLLGFLILRKKSWWPSRADWKVLVPAGLLLWIGGNGLVTWAVEKADSGFAALSVGTLPLWTALVESIVVRRRPSLLLVGSLLVGFAGLAVLHWEALGHGSTPLPRVVALIAAPLCWAIGSVYQARVPVSLPPAGSAAWQQLVGFVGFMVLTLVLREPPMAPTTEAWAAWVYLVLLGGLVAFTAYMVTLKTLPTTLASTYAYVNPVLAVFLGWLLLSERISPYTFLSAAMILVGVAGVFQSKFAWREADEVES